MKKSVHSSAVTTALIYTRVSTDEQARDGLSLDAQLAETRRYTACNDCWIIGGEYQDVMAGTRDDRPQYQALLVEVRRLRAAGRPAVVVVAALDRFGRKLLERVRCREELKALGVATHSVRDGGEVSDLVANVLAAVAQEEVRRLGERVRASRRHSADNGWHPVGWCPWGYQWREATETERRTGAPARVLEVDPATAPFVRGVFERAADGGSIRAIATWVAGLPDIARGGRSMSYPAVRRVLLAPVYVGRLDGSEDDVLRRPLGRWTALVDDATWRRVQEQIAEHRRTPRQASGRYLLTGFLRCPHCGARMAGATSQRGWGRYVCSAPQLGAGNDSGCRGSASVMKIEAAVLNEVTAVVSVAASTDARLQAGVRRAWSALQQPTADDAGVAQVVQALKREVATARQRLTRAAVLFADGDIDKAGYEMLHDKAAADLEAAEHELARLHSTGCERPELPPLETVLRDAGDWSVALRQSDVAEQRRVLGVLIERIEPMRVAYGTYRAKITWTLLGDALRRIAPDFGASAA